MATLVYVTKSTIDGAGRGLFAARPIARNQRITFFGGERIDHDEAAQRRQRGEASHIVSVVSQHEYLDGVHVQPYHDGLASFANDGQFAGVGVNCIKKKYYNRKTAQNEVWLVAARDIEQGEEIFVSYGHGYWKVAIN